MPATAPSLPSLTVAIAAWNSPLHLRDCLQSLARERASVPFEVVVCFPGGRGFDEAIPAEMSHAARVAVPGAPTVPELRKAALARATGDVVAFLEDHAQVAPGWASALLAGFQEPEVVAVGGPVAQAPGLGAVDWGAYLFDYGRFAPPQPSRRSHELSGLNMSFRRALLDEAGTVLEGGVYEAPLFEWINARRNEMRLASGATVTQNKRYALRAVLDSVFHLGRGYAARRVRGRRPSVRLLRAASCALLPPILFWRTASRPLHSRNRTAVMLSLGYLSIILLSWSAGEFAGYVAGAGDSDSRWR